MNKVQKHFDSIAHDYDVYKKNSAYYYLNLKKLLQKIIRPKLRVLEIGCGTGDLLASVEPKVGFGMDISRRMIILARKKYPQLVFSTRLPSGNNWDYIFMSDVIEHLTDPQKTFKNVARLMSKKTMFICTMANPKWEWILMIWEKLGLKMPEGEHYRWSYEQLKSWLTDNDLKIVNHKFKLLVPINIPFISNFINVNFEQIFNRLCFIEYVVAKKI